MPGRRAASAGLSPWAIRDAAMRGLGQARRAVAERAVQGHLPSPLEVEAYREAELRFTTAHDRWMKSRAAAQAALQE